MAGLIQDPWLAQVKAAQGSQVVCDLNFNNGAWQVAPVSSGDNKSITTAYSLAAPPVASDSRPGVLALTATNNPKWRHNQFNNSLNDCAVFVRASAQYMMLDGGSNPMFTLLTGTKAWTMFFVYKIDDTSGSVNSHEQIPISFGNGNSPQIYFDIGGQSTNTTVGAWKCGTNVLAPLANYVVAGTAYVDCLTTDGSTFTVYHNGTSVGTGSDTTKTVNRMVLGTYTDVSLNFKMDGRIARVIIMSTQLNAANRDLITRELGKKYGITVA